MEARRRAEVNFCEQHNDFIPRNSTTDAVFPLRMLMEKYSKGNRELDYVFVDLEKEYDKVWREALRFCLRKFGVAEKFVSA